MIDIETIPAELKEFKHWVCWKYEVKKGKQTKVPLNPKNGEYASVDDPLTWSYFTHAYYYFNNGNGNKVEGIGFVLSKDDPYTMLDLDHSRNPETGEIDPWATKIVGNINSYTEISPSGTGIRIITRGKLPGPGNKKGSIEIYDSSRYMTITGNHLEGTLSTVEDRQKEIDTFHREVFPPKENRAFNPVGDSNNFDDLEIIKKAKSASNGEAFTRLNDGDYSGYPSQSEADLAFCGMLAFWTGNNPQQLDRLFRVSGLYREKWDKKHYGNGRTYGQGVIDKVLLSLKEVYKLPKKNYPSENENKDSQNGLEFPDIISGVAGKFAALYSSSLEVPEHFFFIAFLTCLGTVLSNRLTLNSEIAPQPRLYTLLLGESADDRKSTAINKTVGFYKDALESFPTCWGIGSAEGLSKQLEKDPVLLLCLDEFRQLVSKAKIESSVLLPCITTLYESNRYESRTKNCDIYLEKAYLSMLAASTIETYQQIMDSSFIAIGFPNRLFLVPGGAERRFSFPTKIPEVEKDKLKKRLLEILSFVGKHRELDITQEGRDIFHEWYMNLERSIHSKRLDVYAMRFMSLLAVNNFKGQVDREEVLRVISLMDWQLQVRKIHDPIDADSTIAKIEERIRRILETGPRSERDLKRGINVSRVGLWIYDQARRNLERAKEIFFNKKEQKWSLVK